MTVEYIFERQRQAGVTRGRAALYHLTNLTALWRLPRR